MKIGITGVSGMLGWHGRCRIHCHPDHTAIGASRDTFANEETLDRFVKGCDAIIHFAGMNRGDDNNIYDVNVHLAEALVSSLERTKCSPHVVFSSSIHVDRDTAYGRSKGVAAGLLSDWAKRRGALFSNLILPHVFGEGGKPNHNSVISTFCHQLASGMSPRIEQDTMLKLIHAQEVIDIALGCIDGYHTGDVRPDGHDIRVSEVLGDLMNLISTYHGGVIPTFRNLLSLQLLNICRFYEFDTSWPSKLPLHTDNRGSLYEAVKSEHGGQAFISTTNPGVTRGNHFHFNKLERFLVVQGRAIIRVRRLFGTSVREFRVTGDQPTFIDMPTLHTHNITNIGDKPLITLFWSHEFYDPESPDTFSETV